MDLKEIQELIKFVSKSGVSEVEIDSKGFKIVIRTGIQQQHTVVQAHAPIAPVVTHVVAPAPTPAIAPAPAKATETSDSSKYVTIKSPMIGTFYRSAGPDKPTFVNIGDEIKAGKVVCIIEAMKLFNEIESEITGRVVKVLVDDAKPIEYDQPLFLVEPM